MTISLSHTMFKKALWEAYDAGFRHGFHDAADVGGEKKDEDSFDPRIEKALLKIYNQYNWLEDIPDAQQE